jgi:hypothetical protein
MSVLALTLETATAEIKKICLKNGILKNMKTFKLTLGQTLLI